MLLSCFSYVWLFATLWTIAHQTLLSMGFSRQEYWSGFPFPSPGESSHPRDQTHISCVSCFGRWVLYHYSHLESLLTGHTYIKKVFKKRRYHRLGDLNLSKNAFSLSPGGWKCEIRVLAWLGSGDRSSWLTDCHLICVLTRPFLGVRTSGKEPPFPRFLFFCSSPYNEYHQSSQSRTLPFWCHLILITF